MKKGFKLNDIAWHRILIGALLLIILVMAFNMNPKIKIDIDNGDFLDIINTQCFTKDELSFECRYPDGGDFIPVARNGEKFWKCDIDGLELYEVKAC